MIGWYFIEEDLAESAEEREGQFADDIQDYADRHQAFEVFYAEREAA